MARRARRKSVKMFMDMARRDALQVEVSGEVILQVMTYLVDRRSL